MAAVATRTALAAVLLLAFFGSAAGRITQAKVRRDDRQIILIARPFGFGTDGHIDITLSNQTLYRTPGSSKPDASKLGIFVTTAEAETQLEADLGTDGTCILENKHVSTLFTFQVGILVSFPHLAGVQVILAPAVPLDLASRGG